VVASPARVLQSSVHGGHTTKTTARHIIIVANNFDEESFPVWLEEISASGTHPPGTSARRRHVRLRHLAGHVSDTRRRAAATTLPLVEAARCYHDPWQLPAVGRPRGCSAAMYAFFTAPSPPPRSVADAPRRGAVPHEPRAIVVRIVARVDAGHLCGVHHPPDLLRCLHRRAVLLQAEAGVVHLHDAWRQPLQQKTTGNVSSVLRSTELIAKLAMQR